MSHFLTRNIKHTHEYNAGGISGIYLLDIRDFVSYVFRDDKLYAGCYAEKIVAAAGYIEISSVGESSFSETPDNGIYRQELRTFIRSLDAGKLSGLLLAAANRYLVAFRTMEGRAFSFGSDGGASLSFSQATGQQGEVPGYNILLSKNSVYPLFEVSLDEINKTPGWILDSGNWTEEPLWTREGIWKTT